MTGCRRLPGHPHSGTAVVEVALVMPVFLTFVFGLIEYGHTQAVANLLKSATRSAARYGATYGVTTAQAKDRAEQLLSLMVDTNHVEVMVKDAAVFDQEGGSLPTTAAEFKALPDAELTDAKPRELILVRATVKYNDVAIMPLWFMDSVALAGQCFARHE